MLLDLFSSTIAKVLGGLALVLLLLCAVFWIGWSKAADARDKAREQLRDAKAQIVLLNTDAALKEQASRERAADTAAVAQAEKELVDAIKEVPDTLPDPVRVRLGCERLRRAGQDVSGIPACG